MHAIELQSTEPGREAGRQVGALLLQASWVSSAFENKRFSSGDISHISPVKLSLTVGWTTQGPPCPAESGPAMEVIIPERYDRWGLHQPGNQNCLFLIGPPPFPIQRQVRLV